MVRDGFLAAASFAAPAVPRAGALRVGAGAKVEEKRCCGTGRGTGRGALCSEAKMARCMFTSWLILHVEMLLWAIPLGC